jgi:GNAT superfamily N-acetyltransferase
MEITVHPLDPGRLEDYLAFFDREAFSDNPEWADCYCLFYHVPDPDWESRTGERNREDAAGRPIGWCNANAKERFARLAAESAQWGEARPGERVLSVVCFVVAPAYRRKGVARLLLQEACAGAARAGYRWAEGYPRKVERNAAQAYHGPLALYRSEGFTELRELEQSWIVRRDLGRARP